MRDIKIEIRSLVIDLLLISLVLAGCSGNVRTSQKVVKSDPVLPAAEDTADTGKAEDADTAELFEDNPEYTRAEDYPAAQDKKYHKVWIWQETGDCLWNISKKYYGDPHMWQKIYYANKSRIRDPRVIFPKQKLIIPPSEMTLEEIKAINWE